MSKFKKGTLVVTTKNGMAMLHEKILFDFPQTTSRRFNPGEEFEILECYQSIESDERSVLFCFDRSISNQYILQINTCDIEVKQTLKKKDNKLKLTKDDIGKKFITKDGSIVIGVSCSKVQFVTMDCKGVELFNVHKLDGHSADFDADGDLMTCLSIVKRHEPRWWISQLPDADSFCHTVQAIRCNDVGIWIYMDNSFKWIGSVCVKMPFLNEEEYKNSEITINELRELQRAGK